MVNFEKAVMYLIDNEGREYTNEPLDNGGPTKFGITQETLSYYRVCPTSPQDVENLTEAEAQKIYEALYWKPCGCNEILSQAVATALLDTAALDGTPRATRWAQGAAGVEVDGHMGPKSIEQINKLTASFFMSRFIPQIQHHYIEIVKEHPPQIRYLDGWLQRSQKLLTLLDMT